MENTTQLTKRFTDLFLDGKWITNTNYKELLSDVDWQQATHKIDSLNTIAALTFHVNYYLAGIINVFAGGSLDIRDKYSFDLPPIKVKEDWDKLYQELLANAEAFALHIGSLSEHQLEEPFVKDEYGSYRRNIEGVIEHSYYHLGQVSLLRKMILETGKTF